MPQLDTGAPTQTQTAQSADPRGLLTQQRDGRFARIEPKGKRVHTARERAELLLDEGPWSR